MNTDNLYNVIFKRKSIRKYDLEPLSDLVLKDISNYINTLKPMYKDIEVEMKIVKQEAVKSLLPIKAPYYILVSSENKEGYLTNVGFMLQQADLYLSSNGIGSCWVGMAKPKKQIITDSKLEYVIALAFGKSSEKVHRDNITDFKRKDIEQIRDQEDRDKLIETARLAPSATNGQPWFFSIDNDSIHVFCTKSNFIKGILYKKMNQIDMGIAICHLWLASNHFNMEFQLTTDNKAAEKPPAGYYYIKSLIIK